MKIRSLSHLPDHVLVHDLATHLSRERADTAVVLAYLAEVDSRRLYIPAGHSSMYSYCVDELHFSEKAAYKRICVARMTRRFPAIFEAVAEGRLHLTAVYTLAPYLTQETAEELLAAATHKTRSQIEKLLAERFPRPDLPTRVRAIAPKVAAQMSPGTVGGEQLDPRTVELPLGGVGTRQLDSDPVAVRPASGPVEYERSKVTPLAPQRYALQFTIGQSTHDKLSYVQALLGHRVAPGDVAEVFDRALDALIHEVEKRKFAATDRPQRSQRRSANKRHIPAEVKQAVWQRDGGRCTFVSATGRRCASRHALEFDHVDPVARGGQATSDRMRLRCRAHNQYEAERLFGTEFMKAKRQDARRAAAQVARRGAS